MKKILGIAVLMLMLCVSAVFAADGGLTLEFNDGSNISVPIPPDDGDRWHNNVKSAVMHGGWNDADITVNGYGQSNGEFTLNVAMGDGLNFAPDGGWFNAYAMFGYGSSPVQITNTSLTVMGSENAAINLLNGGMSFFGGSSVDAANVNNTYGLAEEISEGTSISLQGASPSFTATDGFDGIMAFYGGSSVSDYTNADSGGITHTIRGTSSAVVGAPWKLGDNDSETGVVHGGGYAGGTANLVISGKSRVTLDNADASVADIYGGSEISDEATGRIDGGTEVMLNKGGIGFVVGGGIAKRHGKDTVAATHVEIRDVNAPVNAEIYGGGQAGAQSDEEGDGQDSARSTVTGDTYILIEPSSGHTGRGVSTIYGGAYMKSNGKAEVQGNTNIVISGDAALNLIQPQDAGDWAHIAAGSYIRNENAEAENSVKGDGNITFKNISDISKLLQRTTLNGQGHRKSSTGDDGLSLYDKSVAGISRLIFDNVQGITGARTFQFDELIFRNGTDMTFNRSLSQRYSEEEADDETAALIVEEGCTLRIAHDPTGDTGNPVLGNAVIETNATLIVEDGMTLILNNSLVNRGTIDGKVIVKGVEPVTPPVTPSEESGVTAVEVKTVTEADEIPSGVQAIVEAQPDGTLVVPYDKFLEAVDSAGKSEQIDTTAIKSFPAFSADIKEGKTVLVSFSVNLDAFSDKKFSDITLCKVVPGGVLEFEAADSLENISGGQFVITTPDGKPVDYTLSPQEKYGYFVNFAVTDGSAYDLDDTDGVIFDPAMLAVKKAPQPSPETSGSSGGGGCNAGWGAMVLTAFIPIVIFRKK